MSNDILQTKETDLWRCTVCGRVGTVGRCCGEETRERVNMEQLLAEVYALREALAAMVLWFPSADTYLRLGFDPSAPMEALKEAKAVLFKVGRNWAETY